MVFCPYLYCPQANALSLGLMELARHSDFQHKLRAEIYSYRAASPGKLTYDNMPLLNAFIKVGI